MNVGGRAVVDTITQTVVDGLMLLGFGLEGEVIYTVHDDTPTIERLYTFAKPIAERRSIDGKHNTVLSIHPTESAMCRIDEWHGSDGLVVPEDVTIGDTTLDLLLRCNGSERADSDEVEVQVPPLDTESAERLFRAFREQDIDARGGIGREPLRLSESAQMQDI